MDEDEDPLESMPGSCLIEVSYNEQKMEQAWIRLVTAARKSKTSVGWVYLVERFLEVTQRKWPINTLEEVVNPSPSGQP